MSKLRIGRNARENLKGPGYHLDKDDDGNVLFLEDADGVPKGSFYNPVTGQQFTGLPTDPWSLEYWTKVRRYQMGVAPAKLQAEWKKVCAQRAKKKVGASNKPMTHDLPMNAQAEDVKALKDQVSSLESMVKELLAKLTGPGAPASEPNGSPVVE